MFKRLNVSPKPCSMLSPPKSPGSYIKRTVSPNQKITFSKLPSSPSNLKHHRPNANSIQFSSPVNKITSAISPQRARVVSSDSFSKPIKKAPLHQKRESFLPTESCLKPHPVSPVMTGSTIIDQNRPRKYFRTESNEKTNAGGGYLSAIDNQIQSIISGMKKPQNSYMHERTNTEPCPGNTASNRNNRNKSILRPPSLALKQNQPNFSQLQQQSMLKNKKKVRISTANQSSDSQEQEKEKAPVKKLQPKSRQSEMREKLSEEICKKLDLGVVSEEDYIPTTRTDLSTMRKKLSIDDFVKGKFLGKGNFGQVFIVKHRTTGFVCALKQISKSQVKQQHMQQQLTRQIKIHLSLSHPNVCNLFGFFNDSKFVYLLMQLCSDGMVYNLLKKRRRLPEESAAFLIKQVCLGVRYLHGRGIVHRDIKPENIILENGLAKICDFGWAAECKGTRRTMCGTPLYYSPEVVKGVSYDNKIDTWAIGILTYELIIGKIPFKIWSELELSRICDDEIEFPDWVEISPKAKDFIFKILQKDPSDRISISKLLVHPFLAGVNVNHYYAL